MTRSTCDNTSDIAKISCLATCGEESPPGVKEDPTEADSARLASWFYELYVRTNSRLCTQRSSLGTFVDSPETAPVTCTASSPPATSGCCKDLPMASILLRWQEWPAWPCRLEICIPVRDDTPSFPNTVPTDAARQTKQPTEKDSSESQPFATSQDWLPPMTG